MKSEKKTPKTKKEKVPKIKKEKTIQAKKEKIKKEKNVSPKVKKERKPKKIWSKIFALILMGLIAGASLFLVFALYIIISAPNFDKDLLYKKEATIIYDINGEELARIGRENRSLITYEDLPQVFVDALIATEDSRFFQHNGIDIARFIKASLGQVVGKDGAGGASTLSMQLIKKTYTDDVAIGFKGITRKFTDIYMSIFKLENCYTKEEIIEFYANALWFGNDGSVNYDGIFGVEQASQYFFGKSIRELTLAEATILVGMYQSPVYYNPYTNPEGCRQRQTTVLNLMVKHGYLSSEERAAVLEIPIESLLKDDSDGTTSNRYQAVIDHILYEVKEKTGVNPYSTPMKIYSTINPKVQDVLIRMEDGEFYKWKNEYSQEGTAITSVVDGSIVALSGGRNYKPQGTNRATQMFRQPGSTAKPIFDYAPYIQYLHGSTGDYLFDEKYTYTDGTPLYDADNKFQGLITVRQSLVGSRNITALQVFQKVYKKNKSYITDTVHKMGISYGNNLYESASIGSFDGVSPLQLSAAFAVFARGGYYIEPYVFTKVVYENGTSYEYKYQKQETGLSAGTCYMITDMLIDAVKDGWSGNISIKGTQVAGKTGTTDVDDQTLINLGIPLGTIRDSWSVTYSPEYSIAFWYGYDNLTKKTYMNTNEGWKYRSEIMSDLAKNIYSTNKKFKKPSSVIAVEVEKETFPLQLPSEYTPEDMRMTELFIDGTEPQEVSTRYSKLNTASNGNYNVANNKVTLTWDKIPTPSAVDETYLADHFNKYYSNWAAKYYEARINYNKDHIGSLGYDVYLKNDNGELTYVTWVADNTYTQSVEAGKTYTFVIKSAYKTFKDNASSGLTITAHIGNSTPDIPGIETPEEPQPPIENPVTPPAVENPENPSEPGTENNPELN